MSWATDSMKNQPSRCQAKGCGRKVRKGENVCKKCAKPGAVMFASKKRN